MHIGTTDNCAVKINKTIEKAAQSEERQNINATFEKNEKNEITEISATIFELE